MRKVVRGDEKREALTDTSGPGSQRPGRGPGQGCAASNCEGGRAGSPSHFQGVSRQLPAVLRLRGHNQKYVLLTKVTPGLQVLPEASVSFSEGADSRDLAGAGGRHRLATNGSRGSVLHRPSPRGGDLAQSQSDACGSRGPPYWPLSNRGHIVRWGPRLQRKRAAHRGWGSSSSSLMVSFRGWPRVSGNRAQRKPAPMGRLP